MPETRRTSSRATTFTIREITAVDKVGLALSSVATGMASVLLLEPSSDGVLLLVRLQSDGNLNKWATNDHNQLPVSRQGTPGAGGPSLRPMTSTSI